jgi:GGDEF domain-containing protein
MFGFTDHAELQRLCELLRLATRDPLTGCFNRRALFEKLELLFQEAREQGTSLRSGAPSREPGRSAAVHRA